MIDEIIDETKEVDEKIETVNAEKEWTIMVYMAGDNNLSEDMITGLKGMKSLNGIKGVNLIALYDGNYPPIPVKIYNFSNNIISQRGFTLLEDFEEKLDEEQDFKENREEFFKIKEFVPRIIKKYPAKKYGLILSGHSDGVLGKTLLRDENPNITLDLKKIKWILREVLPRENDGEKRKFDLLGFDGCLMSMVEVGYELRHLAKVLVASEGNIPTTGWAYEEVLKELKEKDGKLNEKELARAIVKKYADFNEDYGISGRSIDISACDLSKAEPLSKRIYVLANHIYRLLNLPTKKETEADEQKRNENLIIKEHFIDCILLSHHESQTFMHNQAIDLLDFIHNLLKQSIKKIIEMGYLFDVQFPLAQEKSTRVTDEIYLGTKDIFDDFIKIREIITGAQVAEGASENEFNNKNEKVVYSDDKYILASCSIGSEYQFSNGVSIFFPWTSLALNMIKESYAKLDFNDYDIWLDLIKKIVSLTLRQNEDETEKIINKSLNLGISFYSELAHREHGGKEHGGKEHGGKDGLQSFYRYFSQIRNYDLDFVKKRCDEQKGLF